MSTPIELAAPPPILRRPAVDRLRPGLLVAVVAAGVGFDLGLRTEVTSVAASLGVAACVAALWLAGIRRPPSTVFLGGALVFALLLPLRASTWLAALNSLAVLAALALAVLASGTRRRTWSGATIATAVVRSCSGLFGPGLIARSVRPTGRLAATRWLPMLRGLMLAAVPVAVLTALLASADAVFASLLTPDIDLAPAVGHGVLIAIGTIGAAGLVAVATTADDPVVEDRRLLGTTEAIVVLASVAALFAGFAAVQLYSALGRADELLAAEGLTPAAYARSGYFQLLWVATLTAMLLAGLHLAVTPGRGRARLALRTLSASVATLTCVIVVVAVVGLDRYTDAFGQTTLRWYSDAFAWMLGIAFVLVALAEVFHLTRMLPAALTSLTAVTLLVVNLLNPEARIAEHNIARADNRHQIDVWYLSNLSVDAWPVLLENLETLTGGDEAREAQLLARCELADRGPGYGIASFNLGRARLECAA